MNVVPLTDAQMSLKQKQIAMRHNFDKERLRFITSLQKVFMRVVPWIDKKLSLKQKQFAGGNSVRNKFTTPRRNR